MRYGAGINMIIVYLNIMLRLESSILLPRVFVVFYVFFRKNKIYKAGSVLSA